MYSHWLAASFARARQGYKRERNMPKFPLIAGAAFSALILSGFAFTADATPRPLAVGTASLFIPVGDEENAEVQNELEPETDKGTPMDATGGGGEKPAAAGERPAGGGGSGERALEETVGGDGINAIQRESIPPEK
jgi:hypothetical protein